MAASHRLHFRARKNGVWVDITDKLSRHKRIVFFLLCFLTMVYFLQRDYAWHLILLHGVIAPEREGCTSISSGGGSVSGSDFVVSDVPTTIENDVTGKSFGILMLFDEAMLKDPMTMKSVENKKQYAALHGYEVIVVHGGSIETTRPPAWSKFIALKQYLVQFDYLMFFDVDTIIMNDAITLEDIAGVGGGDIVISEDWNGLNTGVFMLKNCEWSRWLLEEAWGGKGTEQEYMALHKSSSKGVKYPFEYEQRAIHYIFQTSKWTERHLPKYKPYIDFLEKPLNKAEASSDQSKGIAYKSLNEKDLQSTLWKHVKVLPQCRMNSYFLYPSYKALLGVSSSESYKQAQWIHGDFVVHMAGHKGNNKSDLFDYCLTLKTSHSADL